MIHELATTTHGRLLSAAIALALIGGGVSGFIHDPMGIALMCVSLLGSVVLSLMAIALSISVNPSFSAAATIGLPLMFFLYAVGLQVAVHNHATWGLVAFIAMGSAMGLNALRSRLAHVGGAGTPRHAAAH